jgi:FeS assembly SUF system regulator
MIRLSKLTDYAVVVLSQLAQEQGKLMTATGLSAQTGIPEPTVSKVLKILAKQKMISSSRGVYGGYMMERSPDQITVHEMIAAMDGPVAITACVDNSTESCAVRAICPLQGRWQKVNDAIHAALDQVTLADLMTAQPKMIKTPLPQSEPLSHVS